MRISCSIGKAATLAALATLTAVTLSACAGGPGNAGSGVPSLSASSTATATLGPTVTATVTTSYDAARVQWQGGATAISADEGIFWSAAIADLIAGETTDSDSTGYAAAVVELKELVALPDAQQSPAQNAAYHSDIDNLNVFFKTPGLYS